MCVYVMLIHLNTMLVISVNSRLSIYRSRIYHDTKHNTTGIIILVQIINSQNLLTATEAMLILLAHPMIPNRAIRAQNKVSVSTDM